LSYIGTPPSNAFTSLLKQDFSTSATTGYTLDHAVNNANDIALFINFVRQEPTAGYAASGTTLTLTSATASSDDMYCVYLGQALQTVNPANASVGSTQLSPIAITGQTAEATIATDDTILIHDTSASALRKMTRANFVSGIGGTNTPAFYATAGTTAQTISNTTFTKMNFGTEILDTDSAYDTSASTFTIPSGKGGLYCFFNNIRMPLSNGEESAFMINVDGSNVIYSGQQNVIGNNGSFYHQYSTLINVSAGDACYLNMYVTSTASRTTNASYCYFGAYKIIT